jgi:choline dehydrogenase-like flavoprotein
MALFDEPIDPHEGIPEAYAVTEHEVLDHPEHGLWGFRIEAIWGTPGIVASLVPFTGLAGKEMMTRYRYAAASLLLVPDAPSGTVTVNDAGRPVIRYEPRDDLHARLRQAIEVAARIYLAAGAREVVVTTTPPAFIRNEADLDAVGALQFLPATAAFLSAHQQGSVRFAPSPARGAADPTGKLYGARDIYVLDSSGFPSSASSHTMAPIITVAHYLAAQAIG